MCRLGTYEALLLDNPPQCPSRLDASGESSLHRAPTSPGKARAADPLAKETRRPWIRLGASAQKVARSPNDQHGKEWWSTTAVGEGGGSKGVAAEEAPSGLFAAPLSGVFRLRKVRSAKCAKLLGRRGGVGRAFSTSQARGVEESLLEIWG